MNKVARKPRCLLLMPCRSEPRSTSRRTMYRQLWPVGGPLYDPKHLLLPFIGTDRLHDCCVSTSKNRKNRLRCPVLLCPSQTGTASIGCEVHDEHERKPYAKFGQRTAFGKWAGNSSSHDWRNVGVGLLRKSGKGSLHSSGLRRPDQLLHKGESLAGRVEGGHGFDGESRRDGGSYAGDG